MKNFTGNLRGGICSWILARWPHYREGREREERKWSQGDCSSRSLAAKGGKNRRGTMWCLMMRKFCFKWETRTLKYIYICIYKIYIYDTAINERRIGAVRKEIDNWWCVAQRRFGINKDKEFSSGVEKKQRWVGGGGGKPREWPANLYFLPKQKA